MHLMVSFGTFEVGTEHVYVCVHVLMGTWALLGEASWLEEQLCHPSNSARPSLTRVSSSQPQQAVRLAGIGDQQQHLCGP